MEFLVPAVASSNDEVVNKLKKYTFEDQSQLSICGDVANTLALA